MRPNPQIVAPNRAPMASVRIYLKTNKVNKKGLHPIVLQVIHGRKRKLHWLGYYASEEQWDEEKNLPRKNHSNSTRLRNLIQTKLSQVEAIILDFENQQKPFTVEDIIEKMTIDEKSENIIAFTEKEIAKMKSLQQKGNAAVYQNTLNLFKDFRNDKDIAFKHIDKKFINQFKESLLSTGRKPNTVSIHLRTLRAIYNRAIDQKAVSENLYPFKNFKIKIHTTEKRAIGKEEIDRIIDLDLSDRDDLLLPRDLFLFSFYMRGMSYIDIAFLTVGDIHGDRITYTRKKTGQRFSIKLTDKARDIIARYNNLKDKKSYIFPILKRSGQEYLDYRNAMRLMNKKLKDIGEEAKIDEPISTYTARHSWATIAKSKGIPTAIISEGLGHDSEETTQIYLDSFENDVLDQANELITS